MSGGGVLAALDIGTTSSKAAVFEVGGAERGRAEVGHELLEREPGEAVTDPVALVDGALAALERAVAGRRGVAGVSLSTAMHALVGLDARGRALTPLITWADTRAAAQAERLRSQCGELHARTGTPLHPMSPLVKLVWLRETQPALFARVRRWVGIKELVIHRLCGEWAVDVSCASGTGLLALGAAAWDARALEVAGVAPEQLAPVVSSTEVLALRGARGGLPAGTPLVAGAGDGPLANVGVGAVAPGVAACSIGTSGALRLLVRSPRIDAAGRLFCYALTASRWLIGGAINNGGSVLRWAHEALAPELAGDVERQLLELAGSVPAGSDGLIALPHLLSERAPHWDALASGAFVGLRSRHRRAHLVRALLEGVCQQLALVLASMRGAGEEVREVRATGGFARSALWRQMLADVLGMPVGFALASEGSAFGAALLGMDALGLLEGAVDRAAALVRLERTLEPDPRAAARYAELRQVLATLHAQLAPAFRAIARAQAGPPPSGRA